MDAGFGRRWLPPLCIAGLLATSSIDLSAAPVSRHAGWQTPDLAGDEWWPGFRRFHAVHDERDATGLGPGWYHEYWMRLTGSERSLTLHLPGRVLRFRPNEVREARGSLPIEYTRIRPRDGMPIDDPTDTITLRAMPPVHARGTRFRWHRPDGGHVDFHGAYPIALVGSSTSRGKRLLRYRDGRLSQVVKPAVIDRSGREGPGSGRRVLDLHYEAGALVRVARSDGVAVEFRRRESSVLAATVWPDMSTRARVRARIDADILPRAWHDIECRPSAPGQGAPSGRCDRERHPPPPGFGPSAQAGAIRGDTLRRVDIRPASCRSYFEEFGGIRRGREIETALAESGLYPGMDPTVPNFPVADFVGPDSVVAVVSHDLTAARFSDPNETDALYEALMARGADMQARLLAPVREHGFVSATYAGLESRVDATAIDRPIIDLVVRHGTGTSGRRHEIERARRELMTRHGIELRVIEIP